MDSYKLEKGMVQVYTGNGKGKTTAALGLAFRAAGRGLAVHMIQFAKKECCGEHLAAERFADCLTITRMGHNGWLCGEKPGSEALSMARKAFDLARDAVKGGLYDLVILDEINKRRVSRSHRCGRGAYADKGKESKRRAGADRQKTRRLR